MLHLNLLLLGDVGEPLHDLFGGDAPKVKPLAAGEDGQRDLPGFGGGEDAGDLDNILGRDPCYL